MNERLAYSAKDAAEMLGISEWKMRELCYTKQIRSRTAGERLLIPKAALVAFLDPEPAGDTNEYPADQ